MAEPLTSGIAQGCKAFDSIDHSHGLSGYTTGSWSGYQQFSSSVTEEHTHYFMPLRGQSSYCSLKQESHFNMHQPGSVVKSAGQSPSSGSDEEHSTTDTTSSHESETHEDSTEVTQAIVKDRDKVINIQPVEEVCRNQAKSGQKKSSHVNASKVPNFAKVEWLVESMYQSKVVSGQEESSGSSGKLKKSERKSPEPDMSSDSLEEPKQAAGSPKTCTSNTGYHKIQNVAESNGQHNSSYYGMYKNFPQQDNGHFEATAMSQSLQRSASSVGTTSTPVGYPYEFPHTAPPMYQPFQYMSPLMKQADYAAGMYASPITPAMYPWTTPMWHHQSADLNHSFESMRPPVRCVKVYLSI